MKVSALKSQMPWFFYGLENIKGEQWRDVIGYDGVYNVSNFGRVKSLSRWVSNGAGTQRLVKERILKQTIDVRNEDAYVKLCYENKPKTLRVATIVGNAFIGERTDGLEYCHLNKNLLDNRASNIRLMTSSDSQKLSYKVGDMKNWGIEKVRFKKRGKS